MNKRRVIKSLLSYVLTLTMMVGIMAGSGVTARAAAITTNVEFAKTSTKDGIVWSSGTLSANLAVGDMLNSGIKIKNVENQELSYTVNGQGPLSIIAGGELELVLTVVVSEINVSNTVYSVALLTPDMYAADQVIKKIDAIGTVEYSDACKTKIDEARNAYDALTNEQKNKVTNLATLEDAEKKYEELKKEAEQNPDDKKDKDKKDEKPAEVKQGDVIKDKDGKDTGYAVTNADKTNFEAEYKGSAEDIKGNKIRILDEVVDANGNVYKVTTIADNALKNAKGKELIIGKNVNKIGRKAFYHAKFKKITIRTSKKAKIKIGDKAFKVKNKKCVIKIKGAKKKYKNKIVNKIKKQVPDGVTVK